jgi:hypothetical protein
MESRRIMSRDVRRVPPDFDWPLKKIWSGYVWPEKFKSNECPDCTTGYAPAAQHMYEQWYGNAPFDPASYGSTPYTAAHRIVVAMAQRHIKNAPEFYGRGKAAIAKEAQRLADLFNTCWLNHLIQDDVDALVAARKIQDLTHTWSREAGWVPIEPTPSLTAEAVNEYHLSEPLASPNAGAVIHARCEREGVVETCPTCEGHGALEAYPGQRAESAAWKMTDPPTGDGWQLWESVSDGSPITPVFATAELLVDWLTTRGEKGDPVPYRRAAAEALVKNGGGMGGTGIAIGGEMFDSARDADRILARMPGLDS